MVNPFPKKKKKKKGKKGKKKRWSPRINHPDKKEKEKRGAQSIAPIALASKSYIQVLPSMIR